MGSANRRPEVDTANLGVWLCPGGCPGGTECTPATSPFSGQMTRLGYFGAAGPQPWGRGDPERGTGLLLNLPENSREEEEKRFSGVTVTLINPRLCGGGRQAVFTALFTEEKAQARVLWERFSGPGAGWGACPCCKGTAATPQLWMSPRNARPKWAGHSKETGKVYFYVKCPSFKCWEPVHILKRNAVSP